MEQNSSATNLTDASLRASKNQVKQILSLLHPCQLLDQQPSYVGIQNGLLHSLHNILSPLNDVVGMQSEGDQDISSEIDPTTQRAPSSSRGLDIFIQNATTLLQLTDQVRNSLKEPIPGFSMNSTALQLLEQRLKDAPLQPKDQQKVLLRLRRMRRTVMPEGRSPEPLDSKSASSRIRSPLHPIPSELKFEATSPWIDYLVDPEDKYSLKGVCIKIVDAFNAYMDKRCEDESVTFKNIQGDRYLARRRVRARMACWKDSRAEIHIELRDVACVNLQFEWSDSGIQILHTDVCSPNEYLQDQVNLLLPSKYGLYNDLSTHLFIHALHRQNQEMRPIVVLCTTLMHVAGLRTFFDPLPVSPSTVAAIHSRTVYGSLQKEANEEFTRLISWKWCRIAGDPASPPQGEWVAFSPHMM